MSPRGPTITTVAVAIGAALVVVLAATIACPGLIGVGSPPPADPSRPPATAPDTGSDAAPVLVMRIDDSGPWSLLNGSIVDRDLHVALRRAEDTTTGDLPSGPDPSTAPRVRYRLWDPTGAVSVRDVASSEDSGVYLPLGAAEAGSWRLEAQDEAGSGPMAVAGFTVTHTG